MDYQKIDISLQEACDEEALTHEPNLIVFVRTTEPPNDEQREELKRLGVKVKSAREKIFTAQISSHAVSELSDKPWVRLISLSQQLKPLA